MSRLTNLLRSLLQRAPRPSTPRSRGVALCVEPLEQRAVPASLYLFGALSTNEDAAGRFSPFAGNGAFLGGARSIAPGQGSVITVETSPAAGPGSRDSHWRESVFGNELMSPSLNAAD